MRQVNQRLVISIHEDNDGAGLGRKPRAFRDRSTAPSEWGNLRVSATCGSARSLADETLMAPVFRSRARLRVNRASSREAMFVRSLSASSRRSRSNVRAVVWTTYRAVSHLGLHDYCSSGTQCGTHATASSETLCWAGWALACASLTLDLALDCFSEFGLRR